MPAVKLVIKWVVALPTEQLAASIDLDACRSFCDAMLQEADKSPDSDTGKGLARYAHFLSSLASKPFVFIVRMLRMS